MLNNPTVVLHEISVHLFEPFSPMLSQRCEINNVSKVIKSKNDVFFVDIKLDGERFQLHWDKDKNQFKYFSRYVGINRYKEKCIEDKIHFIILLE